MWSMKDMFYSQPEPVWIVKPASGKSEEEKKGEAKKETKVTVKVSICCRACEERLTGALMSLAGIKDVVCDFHKEKVVVTCTTATPGDVLSKCQREFKGARLWKNED